MVNVTTIVRKHGRAALGFVLGFLSFEIIGGETHDHQAAVPLYFAFTGFQNLEGGAVNPQWLAPY